MRLEKILFVSFLIILSFCNCARQTIKKQLTEEEILCSIPRWQESFKGKVGTGEMVISGPEFRYSTYFSFDYEVDEKILFGKLLGSFGIIVGDFYFSPDSISLIDREGKELRGEVLSVLEGLSCATLARFIAWDIPNSSNWKVIPLDNEWILLSSELEISLSRDFLPTRAMIGKDNSLSIEYSNFRTVGGVKQPFRITVRKDENMLQIEHNTLKLQ